MSDPMFHRERQPLPADAVLDLLDKLPEGQTKHYVFMHYGLGWSVMEALFGSLAVKDTPLPRSAAAHVLRRWNEPDWAVPA